MANLAAVPQTFNEKTKEIIPKSKILVVGAGGIGCEVIKNLALSGFQDIEIVSIHIYVHVYISYNFNLEATSKVALIFSHRLIWIQLM